MEHDSKFDVILQELTLLLNQGLDKKSIEKHLLNKGLNSSEIEYLYKSARNKQGTLRTKNGKTLVLIGVMLLGIGFISSFLMYHSGGNFSLPLYGITLVGLLLLFIGLVLIFQ